MNDLITFRFEKGKEIRTLERDGEPWFVAVDACGVLGLRNVTQALENLDDDEKDIITRASDPIQNIGSLGGPGQEGGAQSLNIINESGLYNLIFRSNKPEAREFRKWVTSVVLPSIRQKGYYAVSKQLTDRIEAIEKGYEKFRGQTIEAVKAVKARQDEVEARVDGAYKEVLDNAMANAAAEVKEHLIAEHNPTAHEAQIGELKRHLSLTIVPTGDKRDKINLFRLYGEYERHISNPIPKDAFAFYVLLLYPGINFKGGVFSGCRLDY
jgi:prophage antirepressor-like protein